MISREEVKQNRIKWGNFLLDPSRKKAVAQMELDDGESRCCLGHAAHLFEIPKSRKEADGGGLITAFDGNPYYAPESLVELLGLWDYEGTTKTGQRPPLGNSERITDVGPFKEEGYEFCSLADANDSDTEISPQEIGEYILKVIDGGEDTPFIPLTDYKE